MNTPRRVVVIGARHAGTTCAAALRQAGFDGAVTLVDGEPELPYQRPPLSKAYLTGKSGDDQLLLRAGRYFLDHDIEPALGQTVVRIDRANRRVVLAGGNEIAYDHLVLATGASERPLPVPGADLDGVLPLRGKDHASRLRERLARARSAVVVGGGFMGMEIASAAAELGVSTTVVETAPRILPRSVSETVSWFLARRHAERGVTVLTGAGVRGILGEDGRATGVELADGTRLDAQVVVSAVGVRPNVALAAEAGLATDDGIVVDERLRTADEHVSAIGDCARFPRAGGLVRLESVQNATDQGRYLAARLTGSPDSYEAVPWFWSEQAGVRLTLAGLIQGAERFVPRGDLGSGKFSVFAFTEDRLLGAESINRQSDHMAVRRLLGQGRALTAEQAADDEFDLNAYARPARALG